MAFDIPKDIEDYQHRYSKLGMAFFSRWGSLFLPYCVLIDLLCCEKTVERLGNKEWKHLEVARMEMCQGPSHMESFFQDVIDKGGEGIILRDPSSPYQPGRSLGYLKHKVGITSLPFHM
jgi:hypothetical protein